jgi:hypothetical protein
MDSAVVNLSAGAFPVGGVAAAKSLLHASAFTRVGATRQQVGERHKVGHGGRLAAIERVLNGRTPTTRLKITEFDTLPAAILTQACVL